MEIKTNQKIIICFDQPPFSSFKKIFYLTNEFIDDDKKVINYIDENVNQNYPSHKLEIALKMFNLPLTIIDRQINHLSLTEQLLIKFMIMLLSGVKVAYLNDFLINFDQYYQSKIVRIIKKLTHQQGMTIFISDVDYNLMYQIGELFYYKNLGYLTKQMVLRNINHINPNYYPESIRFINYINQKLNLTISYQIEPKELLKSLYRKD